MTADKSHRDTLRARRKEKFEVWDRLPHATKPVLLHVLYCSTAHILQEDDGKLQTETCGNLVFDKKANGYYVVVPDAHDIQVIEDAPISNSFKQLLYWAQHHGAHRLLLDTEGTVYPQLPTFEW